VIDQPALFRTQKFVRRPPACRLVNTRADSLVDHHGHDTHRLVRVAALGAVGHGARLRAARWRAARGSGADR
jgi:hypothetical protein